MNFIIDGLIVAIIVGCCVWGYKIGLVKMLVNFFKNIVALILAIVFSSKLGAFLYDMVFKGIFEGVVIKKITEWLPTDASIDIKPLISSEHSEFVKFLEKIGFSLEEIELKYEEFGADAGELIIEYISRPLGTAIACAISFILIFVVSALLIKLVGAIINKFFKLPGLNITNKIFGTVIGAVLGLVFAFFFAAIVNAVSPYISINGASLSAASLEEGTIIYGFMVSQSFGGVVRAILDSIGVI